jgi:hypothetical protein
MEREPMRKRRLRRGLRRRIFAWWLVVVEVVVFYVGWSVVVV